MEELLIVILFFSGVLTFAFGLAWMIPLFTSMHKNESATSVDAAMTILDLILMLFDCIPFFWIIRAIPEAPSAYRSARETWRQNATVRSMFWFSAASFSVFLSVLFCYFD